MPSDAGLALSACYCTLWAATAACAALALRPWRGQPKLPLLLFTLQTLAIALAWFIQEETFGPGGLLYRRGMDLEGDAQSTLLAVYCAACAATAIAVQSLNDPDGDNGSPTKRSSPSSSMALASLSKSESGSAGSDRDADPPVLVGNLSVLCCLLSALYLHQHYLEGSVWGVFAVAPMALLLGNDHVLISSLHDGNRFTPVVAVCTTALAAIALDVVVSGMLSHDKGHHSPEGVLAGLQVAYTVMSLPGHVLFMQFLWTGKKMVRIRSLRKVF